MSLYRPVDIQCLNEHCDLEDVLCVFFVCLCCFLNQGGAQLAEHRFRLWLLRSYCHSSDSLRRTSLLAQGLTHSR